MPERAIEILVKRLGQKIIEESGDIVNVALMTLKDVRLGRGPRAVLPCFIITRWSGALLKHHSLSLEALEAMGLTLGDQHLAVARSEYECLPLKSYLQPTLDDKHIFIVVLRRSVSPFFSFLFQDTEVVIGWFESFAPYASERAHSEDLRSLPRRQLWNSIGSGDLSLAEIHRAGCFG